MRFLVVTRAAEAAKEGLGAGHDERISLSTTKSAACARTKPEPPTTADDRPQADLPGAAGTGGRGQARRERADPLREGRLVTETRCGVAFADRLGLFLQGRQLPFDMGAALVRVSTRWG